MQGENDQTDNQRHQESRQPTTEPATPPSEPPAATDEPAAATDEPAAGDPAVAPESTGAPSEVVVEPEAAGSAVEPIADAPDATREAEVSRAVEVSAAPAEPLAAPAEAPAAPAATAEAVAAPAEQPLPAEPPAEGELPAYLPPPLPSFSAAGQVSLAKQPQPSGPTEVVGTTSSFVPQAAVPPPRRDADRRRAWRVGVPTVAGSLIVALLVFFASSSVFDAVGQGDAAPAAAPSSTAPVMSPEAYAQMLTSADASLAAAFQRFAAAAGPAALDTTATALATAIDKETDQLSAVRPPEAAKQAHELLVNGLNRLQWEPAGVDIEGRVDGAACTGPAGAASVARTTPADLVRTAALQLKAADERFVFGTFLPAPSEPQQRRMGNGTYLKRVSTNGSGLLKIINNGAKDTSVSLVLVGETTPRLTVYVQGTSSFVARGIADGNYSVFLTAGVDWDPGMKVFSRDCEFSKFSEPLEFITTRSTYKEWTITLFPSESGNAPVEDVAAETYPTG